MTRFLLIFLGLGIILPSCKRPTSAPAVTTYDFTDRTYSKIGWPPSEKGGQWTVEHPGPSRFLFVDGHEETLDPMVMTFGRQPSSGGVFITMAPKRFRDAMEDALAFCKKYNIPTKGLLEWRDREGGTAMWNSPFDYNWYNGNMMYGLRFLHMPGAENCMLNYSFGWKAPARDEGAFDPAKGIMKVDESWPGDRASTLPVR